MPDLPDSTPPPAAVPAIVDPDAWEQTQGFRETLLARFTDPEANLPSRTRKPALRHGARV